MDKFILELPNFIPSQLCDEIIKKYDSDPRKSDGCMSYILGEHGLVNRSKYNQELVISGCSDWKDIDSDMNIFINHAVKEYIEHVKYKFSYTQKHHSLDRILNLTNMKDSGYTVQKIKRGDYFTWHIDGAIGSKLFIQIIIYLNTLDVNDGGRTEFPNGRSVKPDKGKVLIFPCSWTYPHCGTKVKCDHKYICTTAIQAEDRIVSQL